jgi:hypothetical protein
MRRLSLCADLKIKTKAALQQVLLTRVTAAFFVFSLLVCFTQGIMNALLFSIDLQYDTLVHGIIQTAAFPKPEIDYLAGNVGSLVLRACNDIPYYERQETNCTQVYPIESSEGTVFRRSDQNQTDDDRNPFTQVIHRSEFGSLKVRESAGGSDAPKAVTLSYPNGTIVSLVPGCTRSLLHSEKVLRNSKREEIVIVALQFWIFGMSLIAIIQSSVPHTIAVLVARILMTAWSAFTFWRSQRNSSIFKELFISPKTYCRLDLGFTDYFNDRIAYQIPDTILNCSGLLISAYMSWTLLKTFHETKLMRVGAPDAVLNLYKYFMAVLVCLQLGGFFLMSALGLWADQLFSVFLNTISEHSAIYKTLIVFTTIVVVPIGAMGWVSIKRENRKLMAVFLALLFVLLAGWGCMFGSQVWRWTFMDWPMLAALNVASLILIAASMILGGICWLNFGKGLGHYLYVQDMLASFNFSHGIFKSNHDDDDVSSISKGSNSKGLKKQVPLRVSVVMNDSRV